MTGFHIHIAVGLNRTERSGTSLRLFETLLGTLRVALPEVCLPGAVWWFCPFFAPRPLSLCYVYKLTTQLNKGKPGPGL